MSYALRSLALLTRPSPITAVGAVSGIPGIVDATGQLIFLGTGDVRGIPGLLSGTGVLSVQQGKRVLIPVFVTSLPAEHVFIPVERQRRTAALTAAQRQRVVL